MTKRQAKRKPKFRAITSLTKKYSGRESDRFWHVVNQELPGDKHEAGYALGVALQNLEEFVLRFMDNAREAGPRKGGKG